MDSTVSDPVLERAAAGAALTPSDRQTLHTSTDVLGLGMAADQARRRRHGEQMTFLRVLELPLGTTDLGIRGLTVAGEVRITGTPGSWDDACSFVRVVSDLVGGRVPVSGFSLADIERTAKESVPHAVTLARRLREAGLDLVAEAPIDRLRQPAAMIHAAVEAGLAVLRLTVDVSPADERIQLLEHAAAVVGKAPSIRAFAPLPRQPTGDAPTTGFQDVRLVALARLLVGVDHIQVDWPLYGPKLAQVGLTFGADDVDGVSPLEETGEGRRRAPLEEVRRNIRAASGDPVERDGRFLLRS
jgi:aminodeoxyfutalosine synthase